MQELRFVAVSEDGSYAVLAVPGRSARFTLPIDERLRAVALGQTSRLAQYEIEVESPLRPKEIQARIRAGETAEEIADAAGIPVERVRWFEGPVLAERAYIADQAQHASVRRQGDSGPGPRLGDIVPDRLSGLGSDPEDGQWDSRKRGDGNWQVQLTFSSGGRLHIAEWIFDPRRRHVMPDDDNAARLSLPEAELAQLPASLPGEATVTPLAPRLGAVSAGGMGTGANGTRFRTERPAAQERPAMQERPAYERPAAQEQKAAHEWPATSPAPAAMHAPAPHPAEQQPPAVASSFNESERAKPTHQRPAISPEMEVPYYMYAPSDLEPVAAAAPQAQAHAEPAAPSPEPPITDEQVAQPRSGKKNPRNRRSSVPSWDEVMLGSSRQRD
jgi:hypothetical protein